MTDTNRLQTDIEDRLRGALPAVEVLACEQTGKESLRLTIDHPDGVTLDLCEKVTHALIEIRAEWALEVSSPGPERPLTKPDHYRRFLGRRARVRTREARDGHKSFTGELVGATDQEVTVATDPEADLVSIPYTEISRSNLLERRGEEKA